jgi:hypothetical protein
MNHRPFEDWLLDERSLTHAEKGALEAHLRTCKQCSALAETGLELSSSRMVPPKPGFTARFSQRLIAHKMAERRRRLWGLIILVIGGLALSGWLTAPFLLTLITSPAEWITIGIGYLLFFVTSFQTLAEAAQVMLRVTADFVPPYVWMVTVSTLAGLALLWTVSIWRFTRFSRGVR